MPAATEPNKRPNTPYRLVRHLVVIFGGAYLLVVATVWFLENKLVFVPSSEWVEATSPEIENIYFPSADGTELHGRWLPHRPDSPVLILFHGNGGNISYRSETMLGMREQLGVSVFIFDYPGYGKSKGKPNEERCYAAAEGALTWLRDTKNVPVERVILYGESMGGGVATEMAVRHQPLGLVLVKTFTSLPAAAKRKFPFLPVYTLMSNRFDNLAKIGKIRCPVLITCAGKDEIIPLTCGPELFAAAPEPKQFFFDEEAGHNNFMPDHFWPQLRTFLGLPEPPKS